MTLAEIITSAREVAPRDPVGRLQTDWLMWRRFINRRYRRVLTHSRWSFLQKTVTISTTAQYKTGTISTTAGSTTITGTGTSWTGGMVGRYLIVGGNPFLKITAVGGATSLTVESAYPVTQTNVIYNIVQPVYAMPGDYWYPISFTAQWQLWGPFQWRTFDSVDPYRQEVGAPWAFSFFGWDTTGFAATPSALPAAQIELFPSPDLIYVIRVRYIYNVPDLAAGTDTPVFINPQLLVYGAVADAFGHYAAVMGQPQLASGAKSWEDMFAVMLDELDDRDRPNQNIPKVQMGDIPFTISDDLLYKMGAPLPFGSGYFGGA